MRQLTIDRLYELRLHGMRQALKDQTDKGDCDQLGFDERLGLLIEAEDAWRQSQRIHIRIQKARIRQNARIEELDYRAAREHRSGRPSRRLPRAGGSKKSETSSSSDPPESARPSFPQH